MQNIYYLDTSIWIDIHLKRGHNGEAAKKLMEKIILGNHLVLYSDSVVTEFKKLGLQEHEIHQLLSIAKPDNIKRTSATKREIEEAKRLAMQRDVPMRDALHAVIARNHGTQLVSRDRHFDRLRDITKAKLPENLLNA
ncbi:MAG TPA: PIN domain-containing protein [Candidatus Nanoarchaeia archaeon]|nr:PIN domain-containing protein [Candidatus Nanoarchaeia archaeon]